MLHAGDEYLISTLIPFEPAQISFDPRKCLHLLLILLNQPSFDDLVRLSDSGIVNLWCGSVLTCKLNMYPPPPIAGQENFMILYQSECFFDGLLTLMVITLAFFCLILIKSSLLNYHRCNVDLESACCPPPKGRFLTTSAASKGEKKPAHSDNNDAPAVKLPTEIVEISSDPRTSEEDKVEIPADAYESTKKGRLL
ncbi:hypothetical protein HID58_048696 [Brassica napus]|uniref:Uncharacterized protein n=1 Tax=Brassica napus TaxID=3708 RepID=A0ABQ8B360_BRANA|nr:hypothetical protein HID58_048696 [Brassica napus]